MMSMGISRWCILLASAMIYCGELQSLLYDMFHSYGVIIDGWWFPWLHWNWELGDRKGIWPVKIPVHVVPKGFIMEQMEEDSAAVANADSRGERPLKWRRLWWLTNDTYHLLMSYPLIWCQYCCILASNLVLRHSSDINGSVYLPRESVDKERVRSHTFLDIWKGTWLYKT